MPIHGRLPFQLKLTYGVGQLAEGLKNGGLATFLLFYYNQVLGMSGWLAGLGVGTAVVVDALVDPFVGSTSDRWHGRFGRRHPFMFAAILPLALSFYLLFAPPVRGEWALFAWLVVFDNVARVAMSVFYVPHVALGAEISDDFAERSSIVSYRIFFSTVGGPMAVYVGFLLFFVSTPQFRNGQLNPDAYQPFAATVALLMALAMGWSAWGTRSLIPHLLVVPPPERRLGFGAQLRQVFLDSVSALQCGGFRWLFAGALVTAVMTGVNASLDLYVNTYFWEFGNRQILALSLAFPSGILIGSLVAPRLTHRLGKRWSLLFGGFAWPLGQNIAVPLRLAELFPANGSALLLPSLIAIKVVQGAATVQAMIAFSSMIADVADEHELATGKRQEGILFAASSFSAQAAVGLGTIFAGFALDAIHWPRGAAIRTAADVPPQTLFELGILYGPVVGGFGFLSVWFYKHYTLTRERHAEILVELARRKAANDDGAVLAASDAARGESSTGSLTGS